MSLFQRTLQRSFLKKDSPNQGYTIFESFKCEENKNYTIHNWLEEEFLWGCTSEKGIFNKEIYIGQSFAVWQTIIWGKGVTCRSVCLLARSCGDTHYFGLSHFSLLLWEWVWGDKYVMISCQKCAKQWKCTEARKDAFFRPSSLPLSLFLPFSFKGFT